MSLYHAGYDDGWFDAKAGKPPRNLELAANAGYRHGYQHGYADWIAIQHSKPKPPNAAE